MRYQERIYIQNDNRAVRNKDMLNVNMSSDLCIFVAPTFDISGATKVQCGFGTTCELSVDALNNAYTAATNECFGVETPTFSSATWDTKIFVDTELVYTATFFTAATTTIPSDELFLANVSTGLDILNYTYTQSGSTFIIDKPSGIKELEVTVCISFSGVSGGYTCPAGFSATPANDMCERIETTGSTLNSSGDTIQAGNKSTDYCKFGTYFYPSIQGNGAYPVYYVGAFNSLKDQTGGTITATNVVSSSNTFWSNDAITLTDGRLNNIGLSASSTQYVGFTKCIDIDESGTYYVGIASDNECQVSLDANLVIQLTGTAQDNFCKWSVFPFYLSSGKHIIEMKGKNQPATVTAFGAEVYYPTSFSALTGATTTGQTGLIFSTFEYIGQSWQVGDTIGYSCPSGYTLDSCGTAYTCSRITTTGITTNSATGDCTGTCVTICNEEFPFIDSGSTGVYLFDLTATTLPLSFNFTGNTDVFSTSNATFKFEIYKYSADIGVFKLPPVYVSDTIEYNSFSGTNIYEAAIPLTGLTIDGEYLVKGYFDADVCTDFLRRLGKKINTITYRYGYNLYDSTLDYYFVGIREAEEPKFIQTLNDGNEGYSPVTLYQQVILVGDYLDPVFIDTNITSNNENLLYQRTGSTFVLNSEYVGDILVTLNGLVLANDIDYTLSGQLLTFMGTIIDGDIITIFYSRTLTTILVADYILVNTIPSGPQGTQGNSKYFYNTTTGKYEVYTNVTPLPLTTIMVLLNGVTLANGVDYYQSTTDTKRIILAGSLLVGDIVTIVYYPRASSVNGITQTNNFVAWYVEEAPQLSNGNFSLEISPYSSFSSYTVSDIVAYEVGQTNYSSILSLSGDIGTNLFYRITNTKEYVSICGDVIESVAHSETIPVVIQSNSVNSY